MQNNHLPHIEKEHNYQFITFRTNESTDESLKKLSLQDKPNSKKQLEIDNYLDASKTGAFLNDEVLVLMSDFLKGKNKDLYELEAFAVMPNHVHLLLKPFDEISTVIQKIKDLSAKLINEKLDKNGKFWADDYYAKSIIDDEPFILVYNYIKNNPLKLGESEDSIDRFYGVYEEKKE